VTWWRQDESEARARIIWVAGSPRGSNRNCIEGESAVNLSIAEVTQLEISVKKSKQIVLSRFFIQRSGNRFLDRFQRSGNRTR
jgi:hypothetical protein